MDENEIKSNVYDIDDEPVKIRLKGKEYEIDYSMAGLKYLAKEYGSVSDALTGFSELEGDNKLSEKQIDYVINILYAGFLHLDEPFTKQQLEKMINFRNMELCFSAAAKALNRSLPEAENELGN